MGAPPPRYDHAPHHTKRGRENRSSSTRTFTMKIRAALALAYGATAAAHSVTIVPAPRNAVDARNSPLFANGSFPKPDGSPGCAKAMGVCGCWCTNGTEPCHAGQTCFWFSQGCVIGCPTCTGRDARAQKDTCGANVQALLCDPRLEPDEQ